MSNVDINVDRRTDGLTDGRTENRTPISHPATSRCDKKGKRKVQGVPQSKTAALPRHQVEDETDKSKQAQIDQIYERH